MVLGNFIYSDIIKVPGLKEKERSSKDAIKE